jgi:hypothetical protein
LKFYGFTSNIDDAITAVAFVMVILFTVFGSLLIVLSIVRNKTSRLRYTTHCYIMSLAFGNLLMALFVMPVRIMSFLNKPAWIERAELCEIYSGMFVFCCTITVLSLAAMSVDRYFSIPRSARYQKMLSSCRVFFVIAFLWVLAAVLSFTTAEFHSKATQPSWDCKLNRIYSRPYVYCFVTIEVLVPVILMLVIHCRITKARMNHFRTVDISGRKVKNLDYSEAPTLTKEAAWARVVIKVLFSFIVFWIPRCIFLLLDNSRHDSIHEIADGVTEILTYCFGASLALVLANYCEDYKNEMTLMICPFMWYQRREHQRRYQVNQPNQVAPGVTPSTLYRKYSNNSLHPR